MSDKLTIDLKIYDNEGIVVDGTTGDVTLAQVSDIVDHASQAILLRRNGKDYEGVLNELEEALVAAGLIEDYEPTDEPAPTAPSAPKLS